MVLDSVLTIDILKGLQRVTAENSNFLKNNFRTPKCKLFANIINFLLFICFIYFSSFSPISCHWSLSLPSKNFIKHVTFSGGIERAQ